MTSPTVQTTEELMAEARKAAVAVYIAVDEPVADDLSRILNGLVDALVAVSPKVVTTVADLPIWALGDDDYEHAEPQDDDDEWGHCTVCGMGIMYGSRCGAHPLMAGWSDEHRRQWLADHLPRSASPVPPSEVK